MRDTKEIIKAINSISGKYSAYEVFADWIRCCAISISNSCCLHRGKVWQDREQMYLDTMRKYLPEERRLFGDMLGMLAEALEADMTDILGQVYMESGMGSKAAGQFFTPYHLSELCARLAVPEPDERGIVTLNEPSCGGGGMIIAAAAALRDKGFDYQRKLHVIAQDLDWKGVYMCYLQLSLLGIKAICVQGDTLTNPCIPSLTDAAHVLYTPAYMGVLM